MWPFECREISTFREVLTLVIPFLEGNSKIGLREAEVNIGLDLLFTYLLSPQILLSCQSGSVQRCVCGQKCQKFYESHLYSVLS